MDIHSKKKNIIIVLSFVILFSGFFYLFVSKNLFDSDFWWHIATGRYIVETETLPEKDPFSYTSSLEENRNLLPVREKFILQQYWLCQVVFYLIYEYSGPKGIIILRAFLLTGVLLVVFWRLKRWNVSFYISFLSVFLLFFNVLQYLGERPVLFTILFTALTFFIVEDFRLKRDKRIFLLMPLMVLWANLHGGFIIGILIIMVFMFGEGLKMLLKKAPYTRREITLFYCASILAVGLSYVNPTGWDAFSIALSSKYKFLEEGIQEYYSPFFSYIKKLSPINYGYVTLAFLFPLIVLLRNKKMDLGHVILLAGFFVMAAKTGRYTVYYSILASMVLGKECDALLQNLFKKRIPDNIYTKMITAFSILALLSSIFFFFGFLKFKALKFDIARGSYVPERAVNFIEEHKISGNIFNSDPYGGYLIWRLHLWKQNFVDTRWLNNQIRTEYNWVMNSVESIFHEKLPEGKTPLWKRLLNHYNINFILFDTLDPFGHVPRLLLTVNEDEDWIPVYSDFISIVFIRDIPENQDIITEFRQTKENIYSIIIGIGSKMAILDRRNPEYLRTLGQTFYEMGRLEDALTAYHYAAQRRPGDAVIINSISDIESELRGESGNERP